MQYAARYRIGKRTKLRAYQATSHPYPQSKGVGISFLYNAFLYPLLYILPAYVANGAPVIFGGGAPIDFGIRLRGKRLFGNNKTIRGTYAAILAGIAIGAVEYPFMHYMLAIAAMLALGAAIGDLFGSFIKRRLNKEPGSSILLLDQYGFFVFALLFALWLGHLPAWYGLVFITLLTGALHVLTNIGAHRLRLKNVPW